MKLVKPAILLLSIILVIGSLAGCVLSKYVTPGTIDNRAVAYVIEADVADANDFKGWHNLIMAAKLKDLVDIASKLTQQRLDQMKDQDTLHHAIHQKVATNNYQNAIETEGLLFGETGIISLVMGMTGMGAFTGFLGLSRKRPQDVTPQEMQTALAQATGKTVEELSAKEKQFMQLVKGIDKFIDPTNGTETGAINALKDCLEKTQDEVTQAAVAVAKVHL